MQTMSSALMPITNSTSSRPPPDDNKFVDCAIVSNAEYIVTEDNHFNILKTTPFPPVEIKRLHEFYEELCEDDKY